MGFTFEQNEQGNGEELYSRGGTGKSYLIQIPRDECGNGDHKAVGSRLEKLEEM